MGANAASLFLVDGAGSLRGLVSEWDWIRTSFASRPGDWPTVERALVDGEPRTITKNDASGGELAWFEPRGIVSTLCVPLRTAEAPVGVLFFDFDTGTSAPIHDSFLVDIGVRLGRALGRDRSWAPPPHACGWRESVAS